MAQLNAIAVQQHYQLQQSEQQSQIFAMELMKYSRAIGLQLMGKMMMDGKPVAKQYTSVLQTVKRPACENKSGLFSCPAGLLFCLSVCLPGALSIFLFVCLTF